MKIAIVTISKQNEPYLFEWFQYHVNIGIDTIFFIDNNPINDNGQYNIATKFPQCQYIDLRGVIPSTINSSVSNLQKKYFIDIFNTNKYAFDWFAFIDIDEFLYTTLPIKDFLSQPQFNSTGEILLNWKCYGDNNLVLYDSRPVQERFTKPYTNQARYSQQFPENEVCKCLISSKVNIIQHNVHTAVIDGICKNAAGVDIKCDWRQPILHDFAYIKHYETKTIQEYAVNRMLHKRCSRDEMKRRFDWFFNVNPITKEKIFFMHWFMTKFKPTNV